MRTSSARAARRRVPRGAAGDVHRSGDRRGRADRGPGPGPGAARAGRASPDPDSARGWIHKAATTASSSWSRTPARGVLVGATSAGPGRRRGARARSPWRCTRGAAASLRDDDLRVPDLPPRDREPWPPGVNRAIEDALARLGDQPQTSRATCTMSSSLANCSSIGQRRCPRRWRRTRTAADRHSWSSGTNRAASSIRRLAARRRPPARRAWWSPGRARPCLPLRHEAQRLEPAGPLVVVLQEEPVHLPAR